MLTRARNLLATMRSETGIALPAMMSIMLILGMLTAGVLVTAQADTPTARRDQDRKLAYGAAEAGIQNYLFRLQHDLDLWTQCDQISGTKFVNPTWNGSGADPRVFRTLPGTEAQYTVELLPATGYTQCSTSNPSVSLVQNGLIRIRSTGRVRGIKRSLIAKFRRRSFLDFLYFTDIESLDPAWYTRYVSGAPTIPDITQWASDNCGWYRDGRSSKTYSGKWYDAGNVGHSFTQKCGEIQFAAGDALNGPVHTNDEFLVCGHPIFGRTIDDSIEVSASSPGWRSACSSSSPTFRGTYNASAPILTMPPTNTQLRDTTDPSYIFTGQDHDRAEPHQHDGERHDDGLPGQRADLRPERHLRAEPEDVRPVQLARRLRGRLRQRELRRLADDREPEGHHHQRQHHELQRLARGADRRPVHPHLPPDHEPRHEQRHVQQRDRLAERTQRSWPRSSP